MRTKLALKNVISIILVEIMTAISGIIVPRFFTATYGSAVNGLASSIGQFITYMGLVEAGVSAAATVELYKPLAIHDENRVNGILSAAKSFYLRSGILFVALDIALIIGYPFFVKNEIADVTFIRSMIVVLSLSGIIDYFILGKYRVLLVADQRTYVISYAQLLGVCITMIVSIILITMEVSPVLVKGVVVVVYLLRTLIVIAYVRKKYQYVCFNIKPAKDAFSQKNSALFHQVVGMICNNTDIVLLTIMLKESALVEVSVYAAYNMVAATITSLFNSISNGVRSSFGQVMSEGSQDTLEKNFSIFEYAYFIVLFVIYTCMGVLMYSFIKLYSSDFLDSELYPRWILVGLFCACGIVQNIRIPGMTIQLAAGHYKQTQWAAMLEAAINLGVSIGLVFNFGIAGVLMGTCAAYLYRSTYVIIYNAKHFLPGSLKKTIFRIVRNMLFAGTIAFVSVMWITSKVTTWPGWFMYAVIMAVGSGVLIILENMIFELTVFKKGVLMLKSIIRRDL